VSSRNQFPTASGLASSASGFAALAAAARHAAGLPFDATKISALARQSSASAARSVFGGYVELPAGTPGDAGLAAHQVFPPEHVALAIVVAVTAEGRKSVGSTDGMTHTRDTSPYYRAWVEASPALADEVRAGLASRDLGRIGRAMEQSTLAMHACGFAAAPGLVYWQPATLAAFQRVRELRGEGLEVYATMDAGPHVKALCSASDAVAVSKALSEVPGVLRTLLAGPGPGVEVS
jgi:diphosphomevalonate decarboxylase